MAVGDDWWRLVAVGVGREVLEGGEGGGGGSGTQKLVYQKWPDQVFPFIKFVFSHCGHFGLGGGGSTGGGTPPPTVYGRSNTCLGGGWRLVVDNWWQLAGVGHWWLAAGGSWWLVGVGGGWWGLAVGSWRLVAVGNWWRLAAVGGSWRSLGAVLQGCP